MTYESVIIMLSNPGFSFYGVSGEHHIVPVEEADLKRWGKYYGDAVVCTYDGKLVQVYKDGPGLDSIEHPVALEFASLDPNGKEGILQFCNKYGLLGSSRQFANHNNNYLFLQESKDEYSRVIPFGRTREADWLFYIQREIVHMKHLLDLNDAITNDDSVEMISNILFFALDISDIDFEGSQRRTETFQFTHHFEQFLRERGFDTFCLPDTFDWTSEIQSFLTYLYIDLMNAEAYEEFGYHQKYPQMYFCHWQALYDCIDFVLRSHKILNVDPFKGVLLEPVLTKESADHIYEHAYIKILAKAVLSDVFKENLCWIYPEVRYDKDNTPQSAWRIPTLLNAMYLELFFRLSPNGRIKRCANPTCNNYFEWNKSTPTKIYCSERCAKLMAKRKQREREKNAKKPG